MGPVAGKGGMTGSSQGVFSSLTLSAAQASGAAAAEDQHQHPHTEQETPGEFLPVT